jgi:hypothetical protein
MTEEHRPKPPPEASGSREATAGESSVRALMRPLSTSANNIVAASDALFIQSQPHGGLCQTLRKFKKKVTVCPHECWGEQNMAHIVQKRLRRRQPPPAQIVTRKDALLNRNIEVGGLNFKS